MGSLWKNKRIGAIGSTRGPVFWKKEVQCEARRGTKCEAKG